MNWVKLFLLFFYLYQSFEDLAQDSDILKKILKNELKSNRIFSKALILDLNCDKKRDFAIILQNKKDRDHVNLYVIYSSKDTLIKQNLGILSDTMDLYLDYANSQKPLAVSNLKYLCNSIFVSSNDYDYIFQFDIKENNFKKSYEFHKGP